MSPAHAVLLPLSLALLAIFGCDDRGQQTRRLLAERLLGASPGAPGLVPELRAQIPAGEGWPQALVRHARREGGLTWKSEVDYEAGGSLDRRASLRITATLKLRADGSYHALLTRQHEQPDGRAGRSRREALWTDERLYTRLDEDPWFLRPDENKQADEWRDASVESVAGLLRALGALVVATQEEPESWRLSPRPEHGASALPVDRESPEGWPHWLAGVLAVQEAGGQLRLDPASGAPLSLLLEAELQGDLEGAPVELRVTARAKLSPLLDEPGLWQPPPQARAADRERSHARLQRLLAPFVSP